MTELLPCPFCGGEAEVHPTYDINTNEVDGWFAWCTMGNDCAIKPQTDAYLTEAEAIAAWNTRAERTCHIEQIPECMHDDIECDECGVALWAFSMDIEGEGVFSKPNYCPNCGAKVVGE